MRTYILLTFLFFSLSIYGQNPKAQPNTPDLETYMSKKYIKYKFNEWKYLYKVYLKDGDVIEVNSDILKVADSSFLYSNHKGNLTKILPEHTLKVERPNPYDMINLIEGFPDNKIWRFKVLIGKIDAYSFFINGKQINQYEYQNSGLVTIDKNNLRNILSANKKAIKYYDKGDLYLAIKAFNSEK